MIISDLLTGQIVCFDKVKNKVKKGENKVIPGSYSDFCVQVFLTFGTGDQVILSPVREGFGFFASYFFSENHLFLHLGRFKAFLYFKLVIHKGGLGPAG